MSGLCEIAGGIGLTLPRFRRAAALGLVALLVAVFPANIHMALQANQFSDIGSPLATTNIISVVGWVCGDGSVGGKDKSSDFFEARGRALVV